MKKKKLNILQDKLLRLKLLKNEYFYKIKKGLLQNNNISLLRKNYFSFFLSKSSNKSKITKKVKTCLITGSRHSIVHKTNFSRQQNKRFIILNKYDNIKIAL